MASIQREYARIKYAKWLPLFEEEKPYRIISDLSSSYGTYRKTNIEYELGEAEPIENIRDRENEFGLDSHGFAIKKHEWKDVNWDDPAEWDKSLQPQAEAFIAEALGSSPLVKAFDHRIRRNVPYRDAGLETVDIDDRTQYLLPVSSAHIDSTPASAQNRVRNIMGDDADSVLKGRVRILNIWWPIKHRVYDCPLAVCDGSNVGKADLLPYDHVTRNYVGESYNLLYRDKYKWYYLHEQDVNEITMFKIYDSDDRVQAKHCPHASFLHSHIPQGCLPRESVEIRALVFG